MKNGDERMKSFYAQISTFTIILVIDFASNSLNNVAEFLPRRNL